MDELVTTDLPSIVDNYPSYSISSSDTIPIERLIELENEQFDDLNFD